MGLPLQGPARLVGEPARQPPGRRRGGAPTAWVPQSKPIWLHRGRLPGGRPRHQPAERVLDPKSSESFLPYFSRGWRDDAIQRAYIEATWGWWGKGANNPVLRLRRPHGPGRGLRRLDLGRAALSVLPRARRASGPTDRTGGSGTG